MEYSKLKWSHFLLWALLGGCFTILDKFHMDNGITAYKDRWIDKVYPLMDYFSPYYAIGGIGFFIFYVLIVGIPKSDKISFLGSSSCTPLRFLWNCVCFIFSYYLTAVLSSKGKENSMEPYLCAVILAAISLFNIYITKEYIHSWKGFLVYVVLVMTVGTLFEATMVLLETGFYYAICPSSACLGAPVPIVWLPLLYNHVALHVHNTLLVATKIKPG